MSQQPPWPQQPPQQPYGQQYPPQPPGQYPPQQYRGPVQPYGSYPPPQPPPGWYPSQYQQGYPPQYPPPGVPFPTTAVTRQRMNPFETCFHLIMTLGTCGLWGFVWAARVRSMKSVTRFR